MSSDGAKSKIAKTNDFSRTCKNIKSWSKLDWNPSMNKTFSCMKEDSDMKKWRTFALIIAHSVDPSTGKSCLKEKELHELQHCIQENERQEGEQGIDTSTDVNLGAVGLPRPDRSTSSPKLTQRSKMEPEPQTVIPDVSVHESTDVADLAEQRKLELRECEQELQNLGEKILEKDKKLEKLDGDIILLHKQLKEAGERENDRQNIAERLEKQAQEAHSENSQLKSKVNGLCKANGELLANNANMEEELTKVTEQYKNYQKSVEKIYKANQKQIGAIQENHGREVRTLSEKLSEIVKERDDLKTRFSKLAGAKLTDQNADIADLSDPNRAMKVSEKFGQLYDDEWTDAFEELKKKKVPVKDCIQFLLRILQESLAFCNNLKETQMDSLNNVLLHPSQDVSKFVSAPRTNVGGLKERPRISSKNEKAVRDLRRQIGVNDTCLDEVKQVFVIETRSWDKKGYDKKHLELCMPYIQKCAEICWLMVLHDPPLHMKMDAKNGDKMDSNFYTVYSSSGDKIDFLVWPPLFNEAGGGLITKGVAECLRTVKKK